MTCIQTQICIYKCTYVVCTDNLYVYIILIHKYTHTLLYNVLITIIIEINNA